MKLSTKYKTRHMTSHILYLHQIKAINELAKETYNPPASKAAYQLNNTKINNYSMLHKKHIESSWI